MHKQPCTPVEEDANSGGCWADRRDRVSAQQEMMVFLPVDLTSLLIQDFFSVRRVPPDVNWQSCLTEIWVFDGYYWMAHYSTPKRMEMQIKEMF